MKLQTINTQFNNIIYRNPDKKNNRPSFGIYFDIKPEVIDEFIVKEYGKNIFDLYKKPKEAGAPKGHTGVTIVLKLLNDIILHNKGNNHVIYDDIINFEKLCVSENGEKFLLKYKNSKEEFDISHVLLSKNIISEIQENIRIQRVGNDPANAYQHLLNKVKDSISGNQL